MPLDQTQAPLPRDYGDRVPFGVRVGSLDGLRGIAVLAVVAFHTLRLKHVHGAWPAVWAAIQESSWAGVDLFFVLSGFLITGILLDSRGQRSYFRNFYARRTLRIFPLYYAVLALALVAAPALLGARHLPPLYSRLVANQIWLWTYLANMIQAREPHMLPGFGHFWSLAVEEQFYWVWPIVAYKLSSRALFRLCCGVCVLLPLLRLILLTTGSSAWALRQYTFTRADTILFGALAAIAIRDPKLRARAGGITRGAASVAVAFLVFVAVRCGFIPYEGSVTLVGGYSALGVLFGSLIYHAVTPGFRFASFLSARALRWFGRFSYGIYVFHWPVAQASQALLERVSFFHLEWLRAVIWFSVVLGISSGAAWVSWTYYESRFLALKRYFSYSPAAGATCAAGLSGSGALVLTGDSHQRPSPERAALSPVMAAPALFNKLPIPPRPRERS